jgi:hypothetical protein
VKIEQTDPVVSKDKKIIQSLDQGWILLLGFSGGIVKESKINAPVGHEAHKGNAYLGSLFGSRYTKNGVLDLGLSWSYSTLRGLEPDPVSNQIVDTVVATQAATISAGWRRRMAEAFEVGLGLSQWFGPDLSFSSYESNPKYATFAGADLVFSAVARDQVVRVRLSGQVDLTIPDRQLTLLTLGLDLGLPLLDNDRIIRRVNIVRKKTVTTESEKKVVTTVPVQVQVVQTSISSKTIRFAKDSAIIESRSEAYLRDLGASLLRLATNFENVTVKVRMPNRAAGYAQLAQMRAANVTQKLIGGGTPPAKIRSLGEIDKATTPTQIDSYSIELHFYNVTDRLAIEQAMASVNRQYFVPETCAAGDCQ